jgi:S-adenosylmethionine decarboxylase
VVNLSQGGKNLLHRSNAGVNSPSFTLEHLLVGEDAMSSDALIQLGMDLDHGSSTAQTEEKLSRRFVPSQDERKDFFCERDGVSYAGTHLIIDLVRAERLDDLEHIEQTLRRCVEVAGATLLHIHLHHFTPNGGVSGVAVLAESHISIHSWPEYGYAALDIFMCGQTNPRAAIDVLKEAFSPRKVVVKEQMRGKEMNRWNAGSKRRSTVASVSV